jgi:hypothetical protein
MGASEEFLKICDYSNLLRAAKIAKKNKLHISGQRQFFENLVENIIELQNELIWRLYFPQMPIPSFKDVVVQIALYTILKQEYKKYSLDINTYNLIENITFSKVVNGKGIIDLLKPRALIRKRRGGRRKKRLHT